MSVCFVCFKGRHSWRFACHHGSWVRDVSAGGSGKAPYEGNYAISHSPKTIIAYSSYQTFRFDDSDDGVAIGDDE